MTPVGEGYWGAHQRPKSQSVELQAGRSVGSGRFERNWPVHWFLAVQAKRG